MQLRQDDDYDDDIQLHNYDDDMQLQNNNCNYIKTYIQLQHKTPKQYQRYLGICYSTKQVQVPEQNQNQYDYYYQYQYQNQYEYKNQYEYHKSPSSNHTEGNYMNYVLNEDRRKFNTYFL
jgi:hypothetical protein